VKKILIVVHQATSDPGLIGQVLEELGYPLEIHCPAIGQVLPSDLDPYEGVVVFGGPMSANDGEMLPFIQDELSWIPLVLAAGKPYLGVCLGAQLLAKVLGGRVAPHASGVKEIGYSPIQPVSGAALSGLTHVYHWHKEGFEIPQGATQLASGAVFPNQAFQYGRAYGVQFHPEITRQMIDRWVAAVPDYLSQPGAQPWEEQVQQHLYYGASVEQWLREFLVQWLKPAAALDVA
jgi:GMP synthase (glutamine-hydrolysing)